MKACVERYCRKHQGQRDALRAARSTSKRLAQKAVKKNLGRRATRWNGAVDASVSNYIDENFTTDDFFRMLKLNEAQVSSHALAMAN